MTLLADAPKATSATPVTLDYSTVPTAAAPERRLTLDLPTETPAKRLAYLILAVAIALVYFAGLHAFWAPAHPGVDQNGYLVGGRVFAQTFSTGVKPVSPFQYFGAMWVMTEDGWLYPKYPLGIPILTAACMWVGGEEHGPILTYYVAPVCASLALVAMFLLTREFAGSFAGLIGQILLATNAVLMTQTNNPWSHVPDLAFVLWGMTFLVWWWKHDGLWRAVAAGLLLGYAVLIRYTEGLLLLPMAVVALSKLRWKSLRSYVVCATPLLAWLVPVGYLLVFNKLAMGTWTGYDTTNESTGFDAARLSEKWQTSIEQLYQTGAYFILPVGLLGLLMVFRQGWRTGLFLLSWTLPGVLIYSSYYWGGNMPGMGFLRFFLTLIPPILLSAAWVMTELGRSFEPSGASDEERPTWRALLARGWVTPLAVGVFVAFASAATARTTLPSLQRGFVTQANLAYMTQLIKLHTRGTPAREVVLFAEAGGGPESGAANHLQFATGFEVYGHDAFNPNPMRWLRGNADADQPNPMQPRRREAMRAAYGQLTDEQLTRKQNELMDKAFTEGRRVLFVLPANEASRFLRRFVQDRPYDVVTLAAWRDPASVGVFDQGGAGVGRWNSDRRRDQRGPMGGPPGPGPPGGMMGGPNPVQRDMQLVEIRRKKS